jgi:hypothetical protein
VLIEAHTLYGREDYVMPYRPGFDARSAPPGTRMGASPVAMMNLAARLGYRLVGANLYGFNLFFVRDDVAGAIPAIGLEDLFRHGSYRGKGGGTIIDSEA